MLNLLNFKKVTVEQIHAEFDSGQERILAECDKVLSELKIPTETRLESKAKMLEELGFTNSEPVEQAKSLKETKLKIKEQINITAQQAESIRYFKNKYPLDKFITVDELERICNKYNLIHAPVSNYIKDIPEKNVLEMKNRKILDDNDTLNDLFYIESVIGEEDFKKLLEFLGKKDPFLTNEDVIRCHKLHRMMTFDSDFILKRWIFGENDDHMVFYDTKRVLGLNFSIRSYSKVNRSGLFIAAPKSHFNLEGLSKKTKYGFFSITVHEVKDPVVFEYCKNNVIRIITKWGTEDDQSYLDPSLVNETLN